MRVLLMFVVVIAGCAQPDWPYIGSAADQVVVKGVTAKRLMGSVDAVFREQGFLPAPGTNPQEPDMMPQATAGRTLMAFVRGGQSTVRVFAVPLSDGWSLVAASGPEGVNTFYPQPKVKAMLREAARRAVEEAL